MASSLRAEAPPAGSPENLVVLWTSGDTEVAHRVAFLYTLVAENVWWLQQDPAPG